MDLSAFLLSVLSAVTAAVLYAALAHIPRGLVRLRAALLRRGDDAERLSEEWDATLREFKYFERLRFAVMLYRHFQRMQTEVDFRATERLDVEGLIELRAEEQFQHLRGQLAETIRQEQLAILNEKLENLRVQLAATQNVRLREQHTRLRDFYDAEIRRRFESLQAEESDQTENSRRLEADTQALRKHIEAKRRELVEYVNGQRMPLRDQDVLQRERRLAEAPPRNLPEDFMLDQMELELIRRTILRHNDNLKLAADELGMSLEELRSKIKLLGGTDLMVWTRR